MTEFNTYYGGTKTKYDEEAGDNGDFVDVHIAEVRVEDKSHVNEVGKVVDLLNTHTADDIRSLVLGDEE